MHTCVYIKHLSEHMWWSLGHKQITVTPLRSSVSSIKPQKQLISPDLGTVVDTCLCYMLLLSICDTLSGNKVW